MKLRCCILFLCTMGAFKIHAQPLVAPPDDFSGCGYPLPPALLLGSNSSGQSKSSKATSYLTTESTVEYVGIPDRIRTLVKTGIPTAAPAMLREIAKAEGFDGYLDESSHRVNYFIKTSPATEPVLVTKWRFRAEGALICVPPDTLNAVILGSSATVALAYTKGSETAEAPCVWKADMIVSDQTQYEFWVKDMCRGAQPRLTFEEVISAIARTRQSSV